MPTRRAIGRITTPRTASERTASTLRSHSSCFLRLLTRACARFGTFRPIDCASSYRAGYKDIVKFLEHAKPSDVEAGMLGDALVNKLEEASAQRVVLVDCKPYNVVARTTTLNYDVRFIDFDAKFTHIDVKNVISEECVRLVNALMFATQSIYHMRSARHLQDKNARRAFYTTFNKVVAHLADAWTKLKRDPDILGVVCGALLYPTGQFPATKEEFEQFALLSAHKEISSQPDDLIGHAVVVSVVKLFLHYAESSQIKDAFFKHVHKSPDGYTLNSVVDSAVWVLTKYANNNNVTVSL